MSNGYDYMQLVFVSMIVNSREYLNTKKTMIVSALMFTIIEYTLWYCRFYFQLNEQTAIINFYAPPYLALRILSRV